MIVRGFETMAKSLIETGRAAKKLLLQCLIPACQQRLSA
jgi:hypothetical protein